MKQQIPVTIVTGFLGAGKTTLLSSLIKRCHSTQIALLINEFGQVTIDGTIMDRAHPSNEIEIHSLANGLVAYSGDETFIPTMIAIKNRECPVDQILIETSGLAAPSGIMELLSTTELRDSFQLDATLAVVDAPLFLAGKFDVNTSSQLPVNARNSIATLFKQQLENADVVVLNKIDELNEDALIEAEAKIRKCAPSVRFIELAYHAELDLRVALGLKLHEATFSPGSHRHKAQLVAVGAGTLQDHSILDGHEHSGLSAHEHGLHTHKHFHEHDPAWMSFTLHCHVPQDQNTLQTALQSITAAQPVLRIKGFVGALHSQGTLLIQGVRSRIDCIASDAHERERIQDQDHHHNHDNHYHDHGQLDHHHDLHDASELVFIGYHLNREEVAQGLTDFTGTHWH